MNPRLIQLAERDLSDARDNLAWARSAARGTDWGLGSQSLAETIKEYEAWEASALEALRVAKGGAA
jgi:hypothetical protein